MIVGWAIVLLIAVLVWRFVARLFSGRHESPEIADDADVLARIKPRPHSNAGAVALQEPDEDEQ
jgi:hypothetical protein